MDGILKIKVGDTGIVVDVPIPQKRIVSMDNEATMAFAVGQLTALAAQVYETRYPDIFYHEIVPVNTNYPAWAESVAYRSWDGVTMAKFIGSAADDLPTVALSVGMTTLPVARGGIAADWSLDELQKSQALQMPVDSLKQRLSFRGYQEHAQRVAFFGDEEHGMKGLFNNSNITTMSVTGSVFDSIPSDGMNNAVQEALNGPIKTVWKNSKGLFTPDTLLLPSDVYTKISSIQQTVGTDTTVLEWFKKNNFYTSRTGRELDIRPVFQLDDQGASTKGRIVAYVKDLDNLEMPHPEPYRTLPPQFKNLMVYVPSTYKFGGVDFKQPMSACYADVI